MVEATLPTFGAVLITAAVDSINPCAIGVILLLVATLIKQDRKRDILKVGAVYVTTVYLTYFLAGIGIMHFLVGLPVQIANYITAAVALPVPTSVDPVVIIRRFALALGHVIHIVITSVS